MIIKGQRGRDNGGTQSILTRIHQPPAATIHPPNLECARTPCVALIGSEVSGQKLVERTDPAKNLDRRWVCWLHFYQSKSKSKSLNLIDEYKEHPDFALGPQSWSPFHLSH